MSVQLTIERKLLAAFAPLHLDLINESHLHNVAPGSESHFKATIVSERFAGLRLLQRHREVNKVLAEELHQSVHALALHTYTPTEWEKYAARPPESPKCRGGSLFEH